jgi:hypothetical protein
MTGKTMRGKLMTKHFYAHFENGVLVPKGRVELPERRMLSIMVEEDAVDAGAEGTPRYDDPADPMPAGGVELVDWWRRHAIAIDAAEGDRIARSKAYSFAGGADDDT